MSFIPDFDHPLACDIVSMPFALKRPPALRPSLALILPATVSFSFGTFVFIPTLPPSSIKTRPPSLSINSAIGSLEPVCSTHKAGPVPELITDNAEVVEIIVRSTVSSPQTDKFPWIVVLPPMHALLVTISESPTHSPFFVLKSLLSAIIYEFTLPRIYIYTKIN